eukprot:gene25405-biopygen19874
MSMVVDVQNIEAGKLKNLSVYEAGSLMLRKMLVPQPLFVRPNGTPLFTLKEHMGLEACLMPYMFPYGLGSYVDSDNKFSYSEYLRFRMKTLLSPWTLVKPYLLFSYQIRQAAVTAKACPPQLLSKAIVDFKKENPEASEQEMYKSLMKYNVPHTLPGSPKWHKRHLNDLLTMVDKFGMPSFCLTLTSDEVSETKWPEISDLEARLRDIHSSLDWKDAPVECAVLFNERVKLFMEKYITNNKGILGRVTHHVIRYETEPLGKLNLDVNTAKNLGFTDLDDEPLKIISAMQLSKPVSPCEAACACLGIDMIRKSDTVTFMETSPMAMRTTTLMFCTTTSTPPVDKYCARPDSLEHCKLKEYFEQHDLLREDTEPPKGSTLVGTDIFGNMVYKLKTPRLIRVSDFHPAHQPQGFFYNLLISKLTFRDESHLLTQGNTDYMTECVLREFIKDEEDLHRIMEDYCDYHLYQDSDRGILLEGLLQQYNTCDLTSPDDIPSAEAFTALGTSPESMAPHLLDEFACLRDFRLNIEQQKVYDILLPKKNGLSVISGMGGTGKSLLIAKLTHELRAQGKKVVLAATTGAAATRLSQYGVTAHHLFALPIRGQSLRPMSATHPARTILDDGDVFVIDEHSMLAAMDLNYIAYRLMQSSANYNTHL